jgi:hypothetical protein
MVWLKKIQKLKFGYEKQQLLFLNLFYWCVYILGTFIFPYLIFGTKVDYFKITFAITSFICFYVNYFFVIPKFFNIQNLSKTLLAFLLSVFCFVLIRYFVEEIFRLIFWNKELC